MCPQCILLLEIAFADRSWPWNAWPPIDHPSWWLGGEGGITIVTFATEAGGGTCGIIWCGATCGWDDVFHGGVIGANSGEEAARLGQVGGTSDPVLATRRNISMSRGTLSPERSSHRRIVSADECCVVRSRICRETRVRQIQGSGEARRSRVRQERLWRII